MTKHNIGMVTRNTPNLIIVIISEKAVKLKFCVLCLDRYLFSVVSGNKYLHRGSKENVLSTIISGNVTMCR